MDFLKLRTFAGTCAYLLFAISVSANAADIDQLDSGVSIESWLAEGGREIPVISFDKSYDYGELANDIRLENIIRDKDGSTRFQLSHSGPVSRQVFANVRRVVQDNGYTRSIITNIADGQQTEFLTLTSEAIPVNQLDKVDGSGLLAESGFTDDQYVECPWCVVYIPILVSEAICIANTALVWHQCRLTCRSLGGVRHLNSGICGALADCTCWIAPRKAAGEF